LQTGAFIEANMVSDLVPLLIPLAGITVPLSIPIIWIVLNYRKRRRLMELHHAERMAAIERGMELPPLPLELLDGRSNRRRSSLLPGLVWFFIGLAIFAGWLMTGFDDDLPVIGGLVPLGIGLAYLIYYGVEGRHTEKAQLEAELRERNGNARYSQGPAPL
jgi:hypothetical protein